jgi:hypothetical protein
VKVASRHDFWNPNRSARFAATGRTRASIRANRAFADAGPGLVRSSASPGTHVGVGRANFTATALRPSTLRTKFRALMYRSRMVLRELSLLMRLITRRLRISTAKTAAYARLKRIFPWTYEIGNSEMHARHRCKSKPWTTSTSRSIASE